MGLTVHYGIQSTVKSAARAKSLVERMRQLALDLPFEHVDEVLVDLSSEDLESAQSQAREEPESMLRYLLCQAIRGLDVPWNRRLHVDVRPERLIAFTAIPSDGSEPANIGLCRYPREVEVTYRAEDDAKLRKWDLHGSNRTRAVYLPSRGEETRKIKVPGSASWCWSSFCKTQYASDPACGGVANFLKCHISVITLLERIGQLPTIKLDLDDEGHYGPATYSDDWREATVNGVDPTYVFHPATDDPRVLAKIVGEYNEMIAAWYGAVSKLAQANGDTVVSPITGFSNFEQLEFRGCRDERLKPFLDVLSSLAFSSADVDREREDG